MLDVDSFFLERDCFVFDSQRIQYLNLGRDGLNRRSEQMHLSRDLSSVFFRQGTTLPEHDRRSP
jgi:hypothetical protein